MKHSGAGNQPVAARPDDGLNVSFIHPAVDFDPEIESALPPGAVEPLDFFEGVRNEFLTAETGVHA
ncbi:MAG TPA: hypothetical protein VHC72_18240, partial [Bryobacteraceae bacterium]|nr:hypothetical protein [Bryobacteraceae bacterium]